LSFRTSSYCKLLTTVKSGPAKLARPFGARLTRGQEFSKEKAALNGRANVSPKILTAEFQAPITTPERGGAVLTGF